MTPRRNHRADLGELRDARLAMQTAAKPVRQGMSEPKWTPGPWRVQLSELRGTLCVVSNDTWICGELKPKNAAAINAIECDANAHLIAAAPDLVKALKRARRDLVTAINAATDGVIDPSEFATIKEIDAALTRARGEQP